MKKTFLIATCLALPFIFIDRMSSAVELNAAKSAYITGAFEIYAVAQEHNMLVEDAIYYDGWESHIPIKGKYVLSKHRGTDHSLPYDYDTHVPVVFLGNNYINAGKSSKRVSFYDIPITLSYILGMPRPPHSKGEPLLEALKKGKKRPAVLLVFVIDMLGWGYLKNHEGGRPFLDDAMKSGFVYEQARLTHGPSETAVSHAVLGTGLEPRHNGVIQNLIYRSGLDRAITAYDSKLGVNVADLRFPTIADVWDKRNENKAHVISYGSALRAPIGMAGHGKAFLGGDKDTVFWHGGEAQGFVSDTSIFELPPETRGFKFAEYKPKMKQFAYWGEQECLYPSGGKKSPLFSCMKGSPAFTSMEGDMLEKVIKANPLIGKDNITDLIFINFKAADYCGHYLGAESLECGVTLKEIDKQLKRIYELLNTITGGDMMTLITADHGVAPLIEISGGKMLSQKKLGEDLQKKFDRLNNGIPVVNLISKTIMNFNLAELKENGYSIEDVRAYLSKYEVDGKRFFAKVFTYEDLK